MVPKQKKYTITKKMQKKKNSIGCYIVLYSYYFNYFDLKECSWF